MVVPDLRDAGVRAVRPRRQLQLSGLESADEWALYCLDRAGQLATCNLYDLADTEPVTAFTEKEAARLPKYGLGLLARGRTAVSTEGSCRYCLMRLSALRRRARRPGRGHLLAARPYQPAGGRGAAEAGAREESEKAQGRPPHGLRYPPGGTGTPT